MPRLCFAAHCLTVALWTVLQPLNAESFRVATYNLDGYLEQTISRRQAKSDASRAFSRAAPAS